jgi:hypothetical protein
MQTIFQYVKGNVGRTPNLKKTTFVGFVNPYTNEIIIGYAQWNLYEDYNPEMGKDVAYARAARWAEKEKSLDDIKFPPSWFYNGYAGLEFETLVKFIKRCQAYFKQATLVGWARELLSRV